jgi:hypothetical protein
MNSLLPDYTTPEDLASHLGVSERTVRDLARAHNACSTIGKRMILRSSDVEIILEATRPCHSSSTNAAKSGGTAVQLPEGDYESLRAQRTKPQQNALQAKQKRKLGQVISMDQGPA